MDTCGQLNIETEWDDIKGLKPLDGVRDFLENFPVRKILATKEDTKGLQVAKLNELGIFDLFEGVLVCSSKEKKMECFREIAKKNEGVEIWAIGDRIDSEIRYANELGWKSVLLKRGKYSKLKAQDKLEIADYEIKDFIELKDLLK